MDRIKELETTVDALREKLGEERQARMKAESDLMMLKRRHLKEPISKETIMKWCHLVDDSRRSMDKVFTNEPQVST